MEFNDYSDFLERIRDLTANLHDISDKKEKNRIIRQIITDSIQHSKECADSGDFFEAAEILFSAGEIMEEVDYSKAEKLYRHNIKLWEKLISNLKMQGKLHEVAEIYLRIMELYHDKLDDIESEQAALSKSIEYLIKESHLLLDFNETRKLSQNFQNIAELFLKLNNLNRAIEFYQKVVEISKEHNYYDLLSYSYQQISYCYQEIDNYNAAKEIILDGVDYFEDILSNYEERNDHLAIAQISQIIKILYTSLNDEKHFEEFSKKEASSYINLAESFPKTEENYSKIARYYRGAALCYQEAKINIIETASCFTLAGNFCEKIGEFNEAALNFLDAANTFKDLGNFSLSYKHFVKAGDNFWKLGDIYQSTENYLNAYDTAVEGDLEFNRYGIFNQIVRGLNKVASDGLKNKEFYTAATLILESLKFYEKLEISKDILLNEMVRNIYRYYYRAANLRKIGHSHIVLSYVYASISCLLIGKLDKAWQVISEIDSDTKTVRDYKKMIKIMIDWIKEGKEVDIQNFPFAIRRLIENSEYIPYYINLFKRK